LLSYGLEPNSDILIVNISKQLSDQKHILKRSTGFKNYFAVHTDTDLKIHTLNIENTDQENVNQELASAFDTFHDLKGIFVSSSRVYKVAEFLEKTQKKARLIGYDLIEENTAYLKKGVIHFLIGQRPIDQGYYGVTALVNHLVLKKEFRKDYHLPIDIITEENIQYYDY
jgi:LacI family transcriptional regulator